MNELRLEIRKLLEDGETLLRPPALRRSLRGDMLYATDLPCVADAEQTAQFLRRAEEAGWRTESAEGWILLDRIPEFPPAGGFRGPFGPEAQCCASLLRRHPDRETAKGTDERRILSKAGEEGPEAYERACGLLHREWAALLREGERLPNINQLFFEEGEP